MQAEISGVWSKVKSRENWVLVDLIDMYSQIDVDAFARLREFNKARNLGAIDLLGKGDQGAL